MPLDTSIPLQVQQFDPVGSYAKGVQLRSLLNQGELQGMQLQQARQDQQDSMKLRDLVSQYGNDSNALLQNVRGAGLWKQANELEKSGLERQKTAVEMDKTRADTQLKRQEWFKGALTSAMGDPSDANLSNILTQSVQSGMMTTEQALAEGKRLSMMPPDARRQYLAWHASRADQAINLLTPKPEAIDLGGTRQVLDMNPTTNPQILGTSLPKTMTPGEAATDRRAEDQAALTRKDRATSGETVLRKEFEALPEVRNYKQAYPAYSAIVDAAKRNTPMADINLIYGIAKIYDPTSVVREGEYATVANSPNIPERVKGLAEYIQGGGRLSAEVKKQIVEEAAGRIRSYEAEYNKARESYGGIATRSGLAPDNVFANAGAARGGPANTEAPQKEPAGRQPVASMKDKGATVVVDGKTLAVVRRNPDGSIAVRDMSTGRTGTVRP